FASKSLVCDLGTFTAKCAEINDFGKVKFFTVSVSVTYEPGRRLGGRLSAAKVSKEETFQYFTMKIGDNDSNVDLFNFETPLKIPLTLEKLSIEELTGYFIEYLTDSVIKDKINSPLYIITQTTESKRLETIQTALELSSISKFDFINTKIALSEYVSSLVESPEKNIIVVDFGFSKFGLYHFEKEIKNDQKEYNLKSSKIYKFGAANIINKISEDILEFYNQHCVGANGNKIKKMEAFNYSIKAFEGLTHSKYLPFPIKYEDCLISLKREKYFEDNLVEVFLKDFLRTSNLDSNMDGLKFVTIGSASYSPVLKDLIEKMVKLDQIFVPNEPKYSLVSGSVTLLKNAVSQNLKICDESLYFILDNQTKLDLGDEDGCILLSKNFSQKYTNLKDNFTFTFFSHDQPLYELICTITDEAISENGSFEIFFKLESSLHISIKEVKYSAEDSEKQELGKNVGIKCVKKIKSPLSLEVLNGITSRITSYREKEQEIKNRDFEMKKLVEKVEFYKALLAKLTEDENILSKKNETVYQIQVSKLDHFKDVLNSFELKMLTIKGSEKSEEISGN
ncbi:MAG: hypothetical protein MHPSP_000907, partial [Paramarteilia canceri]